jgi:hypothetical protein
MSDVVESGEVEESVETKEVAAEKPPTDEEYIQNISNGGEFDTVAAIQAISRHLFPPEKERSGAVASRLADGESILRDKLGDKLAAALIAAGFRTPDELRKATDAALLNVKGVTDAALATIRGKFR